MKRRSGQVSCRLLSGRYPTAELNSEYINTLIERTHGAPFPSNLPFTLKSKGFDTCRVRVDIQPCRMQQPYGISHGGVIATLVGTATFWAALGRLPADAGMVNVDLKLNYLEALSEGV